MEMYLIKSAACLAILLVFYKAFLEKESFHTFKRFYLLAGVIASFCIPLITFTHYVEATPLIDNIASVETELIPFNSTNQETTVFNWTGLLWNIYGLGVFFFGTRFLLNLSRIANRVYSNQKLKQNKFINVLLKDLVIPHTFFNYIFLNKNKFEKQEIPKEVLLHEQTHARQKHSIDILLIEILQVVFWFNPLIYLLKNTVKLNHEFLADNAVMNQGVSPSTYQQLLLAFSSNASEPQLANAINYSSIKKRFTVMKTQTSQKTVWLKSLVLLPLLAFMIYGFSTTQTIKKEVEPLIEAFSTEKHTARSIDLKILEDGNYLVDGVKVSKNKLVTTVNTLHQDITQEIRNDIMNIHVTSTKEISDTDVWFIYNSLLDYGFYRIVTSKQEVVKGKGNTPFKIEALKANDSLEISTQKSATREQMAEYNKLAKHYNAMLKKKDFTIKMSDVKRLKYIYSIMSEKQRQDAKPFPDFPKPPPSPKTPNAPKVSKKDMVPPPPPIPPNATVQQKKQYQKVIDDYNNDVPPPVKTGYKSINGKGYYFAKDKKGIRYFNRYGVQVDEKGKELNGGIQTKSSDVIPGQYVSKVYKDGKVMGEFDTTGAPPPPPPPSAPPTIEEMAKKGAIFYLEEKRITSEEAINIVNKNKDINIQIIDVDSKQPTVKLSKKPISFKKN